MLGSARRPPSQGADGGLEDHAGQQGLPAGGPGPGVADLADLSGQDVLAPAGQEFTADQTELDRHPIAADDSPEGPLRDESLLPEQVDSGRDVGAVR